MTDLALPPPSPRDQEIQTVVLQLIEAFAFSEAAAILNGRLREIEARRQTVVDKLFLEWRELPAPRVDFLTYAHHRRQAELSASKE